MIWRIEVSDLALDDIDRIEDFLFEAATNRGERASRAALSARKRITSIIAAATALTRAPYQGTRCPDLGPQIRRATKDRAIFYFDLNEEAQVIRLLAIFWGGQDHDARILARLLSAQP